MSSMNGVVNIHKPQGMTSHDVVLRARRILGEKRIGHTGTLDPMATGVLVLCVGQATRIAQYLEAGEKEYRAILRLGVTTDTLDAEGRVMETRNYVAPDRETVALALERFTGEIMQQPPAFSAVKIKGVPSYKLARQGKAEPNKARAVFIRSIELTAYEDPFMRLTVRCSKGVYIRSLCAELGELLGMGAHLTGLTRTRSGRFTLEESISLEDLAEKKVAGAAGGAITSLDEALAGFPVVPLGDAGALRIAHGNRVPCPASGLMDDGLVRLHNPSGKLVALARLAGGMLSPELVFSEMVD
jgi:tRNA pseudouridine55 synthase